MLWGIQLSKKLKEQLASTHLNITLTKLFERNWKVKLLGNFIIIISIISIIITTIIINYYFCHYYYSLINIIIISHVLFECDLINFLLPSNF